MATQPIPEEVWTVQEYLSTSWSPDRELTVPETPIRVVLRDLFAELDR
jgi:hypothetical protein